MDILGGARTSPGVTLSPGNYAVGFRDIAILQRRAKQNDAPLTEKEGAEDEQQFALRSELWELMRIARFATPGELRGASVLAGTFEAIGESVINPSDSAEVDDVNVTKELEANSYSHIPGFEECSRNPPKNARRGNCMHEIKGRQRENPLYGA